MAVSDAKAAGQLAARLLAGGSVNATAAEIAQLGER